MMARFLPQVLGVDIAMEELVLAHKCLDEMGVTNATLVCASAERLPLQPGIAALVNATSVIEHVREAGLVLESAFRTLAPGGVLVFDSPNRWDLVSPEPHVGLRFVGLWPRFLQETYVRNRTGKEYKGKRLLSLLELRHLLARRVPEASRWVFYWPRWNSKARAATALGRVALRRWPGIAPLLNRAWAPFVSVHEVVVHRCR